MKSREEIENERKIEQEKPRPQMGEEDNFWISVLIPLICFILSIIFVFIIL